MVRVTSSDDQRGVGRGEVSMNLKLTNTGDLDFSSGNLGLVTGAAEVAQKLRVRYRFFLGEWYLDTRIGVPWFQVIFADGTPEELIRSKLMKVAMTCPGVAEVSEFTVARNRALRSLSVAFQARLSAGDVLRFTEEFIL
jgi:hypothetical protein